MAKTLKVLVDIRVSDDKKCCDTHCEHHFPFKDKWNGDTRWICRICKNKDGSNMEIYVGSNGIERPKECFDKVKEAERKIDG